MSSICFYFQIHQPFRLRSDYSFFHIGTNHFYEDDDKNRAIAKKIAEKCYLPTNNLMLDLLKKHGPKFKIAYSISGMALEQFARYTPEVLESFKRLLATGQVELLSETYHHSLAFMYSVQEFRDQVNLHRERIQELFGVTPAVFRNTELIYNNDLAKEIESMGYRGILAEGSDRALLWRSANHVYAPKGAPGLKLLLKNYRLSDDIAFRFSNRSWPDYPLTADKYAKWLHDAARTGDVINLFMDYETFGEHQWKETGIFNFLWHLPESVLRYEDLHFHTPSEVVECYPAKEALDVPYFVSWADTERDLSAWLGNDMQHSSIKFVYSLEKMVRECKDKNLVDVWRRLQSSDHFYYMSTKHNNDGEVHSYFNPYNSPYDAFVIYNNIVSDLKLSLAAYGEKELVGAEAMPEKRLIGAKAIPQEMPAVAAKERSAASTKKKSTPAKEKPAKLPGAKQAEV